MFDGGNHGFLEALDSLCSDNAGKVRLYALAYMAKGQYLLLTIGAETYIQL
jgi:hypothetical protein